MWLISGCVEGLSGDSGSDVPPPIEIVLTDANNYLFDGTLDVPSTPVKAQADLLLDWSTLTTDLQCHPVDPVADIDNLAVLAFPLLAEEAIEAGVQASNLAQVDLGGYVSLEVEDRTSASLSELTFFGTDVDFELLTTEGSASWLVILTTGTTVGIGARVLGFFAPADAETNTIVDLSANCGILDFTADLAGLGAVPVRAAGPYTLGWDTLTTDALGNPIELGNIDEVMLGHYPDHTPAELGEVFLDLEILTDEVWRAELEDPSIPLGDLTREGVPFPGFGATAGEGTWLFALRCSTCSNPAPPFATVLLPR